MTKRQRDQLVIATARGVEYLLRYLPNHSDRRRLALRDAIKAASKTPAKKTPVKEKP